MSLDQATDVGVQAGWCEAAHDIDRVKKQTHDPLIANMAGCRASGVRWTIKSGENALKAIREGLRPGASPEFEVKVLAPIEERLRESGGYLVVAMADGVAP